MNARVALTFLLITSVTLSGCTDAEPASDVSDATEADLAAGKGAIQGLLLDDRFRPIGAGDILLQPLALTAQVNADGEFHFLDLEPGTYTLRATVAGHEATAHSARVQAGEFTEAQIVARRATSEGSTILTEEFSVFIPCSFAVPFVARVTMNCVLDLSGDSFRSGFDLNYTGVENATYLVSEVATNADGNYLLVVSGSGVGHGRTLLRDESYGRMILERGQPYSERYAAWNNTSPIRIALFVDGEFTSEISQIPEAGSSGVGAAMGIRATIMVSLFIGEPSVDVQSYCLLC